MQRYQKWFVPYPMLLLVLGLFSCSGDDRPSGCGLDNPSQELDWLRSGIEEMANSTNPDVQYCYVVQGVYQAATVFRFEDCNPLIDKVVFTLNCEGDTIDETGNIALSDLQNPKIIWRPLNFACEPSF